MDQLRGCQIVSVGKRRDGKPRYWCLEHKADATAKYGRRARKCQYAHIPPLASDEVLKLNVSSYEGGVALWGAVPPIYDTTLQTIDPGIHVHARNSADGEKEIDKTYRSVSLTSDHGGGPRDGFVISELDAIYHMVASIFGRGMKYVECTFCRFPHLDKDWFSVHAHQRHLCAGCGRQFRDTGRGIGNPVIKARDLFGGAHEIKSAQRSIEIRQADYPGGIQLWGTHPAVLWTASRSEEEGIHIHAVGSNSNQMLIDDTFSDVTIDGVGLDPALVRLFMAQMVLPYITGRITSLHCPKCCAVHCDIGEHAFTPHNKHICIACGLEFQSKGRMRKVISNPMVHILAQLSKAAPRIPQPFNAGLLPEML